MAWRQTWNEPPRGPRRASLFGMRSPWQMSAVSILVLATVAVFLLDWMARGVLSQYGALTVVDTVYRLQVWRLLTYQFLHGGFWHIFINMLILWMLGRYLEAGLGRKQFFYLYFLSGVVGGLAQIGFDFAMHAQYGVQWTSRGALHYLEMPAVGASGSVMGVLMAFGTLYPREILYVFIFFFPVPIEARWLALGYFVIETIYAWQALSTGAITGVAHAAHAGGLVVGFVWIKFGQAIYGRLKALAPKGGGPGSPRRWQGLGREPAERAEVDRILEKIHRQGIDSLSTREKLFLQEMSRKYRNR